MSVTSPIKRRPPSGKPIPGVTNISDCHWALNKARRYIFAGGDPEHPDYVRYVDEWLDYMNATCGGVRNGGRT